MKLLILHISDTHITEGMSISEKKVQKMISAINSARDFSECIIIFSGDLTKAGKVNEFKVVERFLGKIVKGIVEEVGEKNIPLLVVPGNHDLDLSVLTRDGKIIQGYYNAKNIENYVSLELKSLSNFFEYSKKNDCFKYNSYVDSKVIDFGNYKIQVNLLNTALFSTKVPDDKELHYFPQNEIDHLDKKSDNINCVITTMHHSVEWFNYRYKNALERKIQQNSSLLLVGHDHHMSTKRIDMNEVGDTIVSTGGVINISDINYKSTFSSIKVDTTNNECSRFLYTWDSEREMFLSTTLFEKKCIVVKTEKLNPTQEFLSMMKEDPRRSVTKDFTEYFVFPKMTGKDLKDYEDDCEILEYDDFYQKLIDKKLILIRGKYNSGKTSTLKYIFCKLCNEKVPVYYDVEEIKLKKPEKLIENLFKEQYGDDISRFEKFQQLKKEDKILIIDNFDSFSHDTARDKLLKFFEDIFGYIIITSGIQNNYSIVADVKEKISNERDFFTLRINPFYLSKRQVLVKNICSLSGTIDCGNTEKIIQTIDALVMNQSSLFELTPDFIFQYTQFLISHMNTETHKGEIIFSKVFETNIFAAIISHCKESADADIIITVLEEIAYYMHFNKKSSLTTDQLKDILDTYKTEYMVKIDFLDYIKIVCASKLIKKDIKKDIYEDVYRFSSSSYLAFFVARSLNRKFQEDGDFSNIEYVYKNICFGINSDIILFISYLTSNTKIIMSIFEQATKLLSEWNELDLDAGNIGFLSKSKMKEVEAPSPDDKKELEIAQEESEKKRILDDEYSVKEIYDYDDSDIDKFEYKILRSLKYTEIVSKAIPGFYNTLKASQKNELVKGMYEFPNRILYALLKDTDDNYDKYVEALEWFANEFDAKDSTGKPITRARIEEMIVGSAICIILSMYHNMAYLSTSSKSIELIDAHPLINTNYKLFNLMAFENLGDTNTFSKKAEELMKKAKNQNVQNMIQRIVRKHLIWTPSMNFKQRESLVSRFFHSKDQKRFLMQKHFLLEQNKSKE